MRWWILCVACAPLAACGGGSSGGRAQSTDLTLVQLNTLNGISGEGCHESDKCRLADRIDLLFQWIAQRGCPDVVTLQEVGSETASLLMDHLAGACPFAYTLVMGPQVLGVDDEAVLTRYPVLATEQLALFPGFRHALWVRVDHPLGPVDVFTSHLASSSDGAEISCDLASAPCPPECLAAGAVTRRDCQAVQMAAFIAAKHDIDSPATISGDFNSDPGSFVYETFTVPGWVDTYLAAGNPECDPSSGIGCTSGREDESLVDLESRANNETERIDYIFLIAPRNDFPCRVRLDRGDRDRDGIGTRLFADRPNPFAPTCGPLPAAICWPSDHVGVELDLSCR